MSGESQLARDLRTVLEIFTCEDTWCQLVYAEWTDDDGRVRMTTPGDSAACRWCLTGAVHAATEASVNRWHREGPRERRANACLAALAGQLPPAEQRCGPLVTLAAWNDETERTIGEVRDLVVRAIAAEERVP